MPLRSGRLRHRVQLQAFVATTSPQAANAYGEVTKAWTTQKTRWAGIEPLKGREYQAAGAVQNEATVLIVIRYTPDIDETWRILKGSTVYSIVDIINVDERNRDLHIMCTEGANDG